MKHLTKPERAIVARLARRWDLDALGEAMLVEWLEVFRELDRKRWLRHAAKVAPEESEE